MTTGIKKYVGIGVICFTVFIGFRIDGLAKDSDYPSKPIEFIITFGIGGATDLSCRSLCEAASKYLAQPIIPINKPGASGIVGAATIKNAKPDGYTIGVFTTSLAFIAPFTQKIPYDTMKDFTPIIHYGEYLYPLLVREDKPWKTWKELVEWGKRNPGDIKAGITGAKYNNVQGLTLSQIEFRENLKLTYISFNSSSELLTNILGGNVDLYCSALDATNKDYIKMGKVRILSYLGKRKLSGYEKIPSLDEMYGISCCNLMGVVGPKDLPSHIRRTLEDAFTKAVKDPSFASVMERIDTKIIYMSGEEMGKYIEKTYKEQGELIKRLKEEEAKKQ